jgi:hypothetical protein
MRWCGTMDYGLAKSAGWKRDCFWPGQVTNSIAQCELCGPRQRRCEVRASQFRANEPIMRISRSPRLASFAARSRNQASVASCSSRR